ncbi:MAG TPA: ABC transporter permease [Bacillota bacterium]
MFDAYALFKKRLLTHIQESKRYLQYILNGHTAIAIFFFLTVLAIYYQRWLAQIPEHFPGAVVMSIIFGFVVSNSPVRTFLKEPDLVFLTMTEHRMQPYFRSALLYSFVSQLYIVVLAVAVMGPLYFTIYPDRSGSTYLLTALVVLIFKAWNLLANWWMLKIRDKRIRYTDQMIRFIIPIVVFYFLIRGDMLWARLVTVLFILVFLYDYTFARKQAGVAWDVLVEKDHQRLQSFYRFANMFTDVPHLKKPVKRRDWLVSFVHKIPFANKYTYDYLYRITFIRSGDYLGMYVRLVVIGSIVIFIIPNVWIKIILGMLFLYMSSFQMMTLFHHHRTVMWLDIYPVDDDRRQLALTRWMMLLTNVQVIIFALLFVFIQNAVGFVIMLIGGLIFNYLFVNGYVKNKLS